MSNLPAHKKPKVPFFKPSIDNTEIDAVVECLRSGWLTTGPVSARFEKEFSARYKQTVHAIAVNSATAALHLGIEALGVSCGDEVIVPTLTFTATAEVVRYLGATPVFVDIDIATLCLDLGQVEDAITSKTKAIVPVHFGGRPADLTSLRKIADHHNLAIIDDAAHAFPAYHQGQLIGSGFCDATAFSFYANKTMTTGEGGMLVTDSETIAHRVKTMRLHGIDRDVFDRFRDAKASWFYDVVAPGFKYNITDLASAIGSAQLAKVNNFRHKRARLANRYNDDLADLPVVLPPEAAAGDQHSWHLYPIQITDLAPISRDQLIQHCTANNIGTSVHYRPLHKMTYWSDYARGCFDSADTYFERCISLPLYPDMTDDEQQYVIEILRGRLLP